MARRFDSTQNADGVFLQFAGNQWRTAKPFISKEMDKGTSFQDAFEKWFLERDNSQPSDFHVIPKDEEEWVQGLGWGNKRFAEEVEAEQTKTRGRKITLGEGGTIGDYITTPQSAQEAKVVEDRAITPAGDFDFETAAYEKAKPGEIRELTISAFGRDGDPVAFIDNLAVIIKNTDKLKGLQVGDTIKVQITHAARYGSKNLFADALGKPDPYMLKRRARVPGDMSDIPAIIRPKSDFKFDFDKFKKNKVDKKMALSEWDSLSSTNQLQIKTFLQEEGIANHRPTKVMLEEYIGRFQ
jgi:predicted RNA-binding protein with TRAM domain